MQLAPWSGRAACVLVCALSAVSCKPSEDTSALHEALSPSEENIFFSGGALRSTALNALPADGTIANGLAWSAHYWPNFRGGVTQLYFGNTQSPLAKFEAAFQNQLARDNPGYKLGDLFTLETARSAKLGGATQPDWQGICDGSAETSITFPEPTGSRSINGVVFDAFEQKAILSYFMDMSSKDRIMLFAGKRFNFSVPNLDSSGRPLDARMRDVNPGIFHLAMANYLGLENQGLLAAIVPNAIVLNFPVRGYHVVSQTDITGTSEVPPASLNDAQAKSFFRVEMQVYYGDSHRILEVIDGVDTTFSKNYNYVLEVDTNGNVVGGEWTGASVEDHPDFLWKPKIPATLAGLQTALLPVNTPNVANSLLNVGNALTQLFAAPTTADSVQRHQRLASHPDNLSIYTFFLNDRIAAEAPVANLPVPKAIQALLPRQ